MAWVEDPKCLYCFFDVAGNKMGPDGAVSLSKAVWFETLQQLFLCTLFLMQQITLLEMKASWASKENNFTS